MGDKVAEDVMELTEVEEGSSNYPPGPPPSGRYKQPPDYALPGAYPHRGSNQPHNAYPVPYPHRGSYQPQGQQQDAYCPPGPQHGIYQQTGGHLYMGSQQLPMTYNNPVVVGQPAPVSTVVIQNERAPSNYMTLAIFVCLSINWLFGLIAIILAVLSTSAYNRGDNEEARCLGKASRGLSISGIIVAAIIVVSIVLWWVLRANSSIPSLSSSSYSYSSCRYRSAYGRYYCSG